MNMRLLYVTALLVIQGCAMRPAWYLEHRVSPVAETAPVVSALDSADDPAIWIDPGNPAGSLVIGTDKRSGLYVYELDGSVRQYLPLGNTNNVDLRIAPWGNAEHTVVAASGRFPSELLLLSLDHGTRGMRLQKRHPVPIGEPYGICMYRDANLDPQVFLNGTDGTFIQYSVSPDYGIDEVRRFKLGSQVEGCVVDDERAILYIAEEGRGIWRMPADESAGDDRVLIDSVGNGHLVADVEGLAIYDAPRKLLIASSQGDNSYAIYDIETSEHLLSFHVIGNARIDGATDTDGIDVTSASLPGFPHGMLVVQDGSNTGPDENQNFKIVSWSDIRALLEDD